MMILDHDPDLVARSQENRWLREEIRELRRVVWMLTEAAGGEIRVSDRVKCMAGARDVAVDVHTDTENRVTVFRSVRRTDRDRLAPSQRP